MFVLFRTSCSYRLAEAPRSGYKFAHHQQDSFYRIADWLPDTCPGPTLATHKQNNFRYFSKNIFLLRHKNILSQVCFQFYLLQTHNMIAVLLPPPPGLPPSPGLETVQECGAGTLSHMLESWSGDDDDQCSRVWSSVLCRAVQDHCCNSVVTAAPRHQHQTTAISETSRDCAKILQAWVSQLQNKLQSCSAPLPHNRRMPGRVDN